MIQERAEFIRYALDEIVKGSGHPVPLTAILASGLATRKEVRKLTHRGYLTEVKIMAGRTMYNVYYGNEVPKSVQELVEQERIMWEQAERLRKEQEEQAAAE